MEGYIGTQKIATLLSIAFVENAFKHGVLTDAEHPVEITLQAMPEKLQFEIRNKKNNDEKEKMGGIGLNNVKRRLQLLYPHSHITSIERSRVSIGGQVVPVGDSYRDDFFEKINLK